MFVRVPQFIEPCYVELFGTPRGEVDGSWARHGCVKHQQEQPQEHENMPGIVLIETRIMNLGQEHHPLFQHKRTTTDLTGHQFGEWRAVKDTGALDSR